MPNLEQLFVNNRAWVESKLIEDPQFFQDRAATQSPHFLWIGCADSRLPANTIVGLEPGEVFVHRNIANLFPNNDLNSLSVLEYAVQQLKVQHVIVCGHYGCGGITAALAERENLGAIDHWLRNIRDVYADHEAELSAMSDPASRRNRLTELNVMQQVRNISYTKIVHQAWSLGQPLAIHAWIYDVATGLLDDLDCTVSSIEQVPAVYRPGMD